MKTIHYFLKKLILSTPGIFTHKTFDWKTFSPPTPTLHTIKLFLFSYKVYAVTSKSPDDVNFLQSLADDEAFDFWSLIRLVGATSTVMVKPERQYWFEKSLSDRSIEHIVSISDLERYQVWLN